MKNLNYLRISGIALALAGLSMLLTSSIGISISKVLVPMFIVSAGLFSFLFSSKNRGVSLARQYHLAQAIGLVVCGLLVAILPESLEGFLMYIAYFVLLSGSLELIFAYSILNAKIKVFNWSVLISRFVAAAISFILAIVLLLNSVLDPQIGLLIAGAVTIIGGASVLIFARKIKNANPADFAE